MTIKEFIHRYVVVHKCAGCSEILEYERSHEALCSTCKLAWNAAKTENCGNCFKEISECVCMPSQLSKAGAITLRRLFFYSSDHAGEPQNRLIYKLKNVKCKRYARFTASQLAPAIKEELKNLIDTESEDLSKKAVITFVPRSKKAVLSNGFDQSELICKELAKIVGIECLPAIKRRKSGKEQKTLTKAERFANTAELFELDYNFNVSGKYVILFDDIVTTGASMTACVKTLRKGRAKGVLCFCIATDKLKRQR